jgi:hypothetical protein
MIICSFGALLHRISGVYEGKGAFSNEMICKIDSIVTPIFSTNMTQLSYVVATH